MSTGTKAVQASKLQPGMVLIDPMTGQPTAEIDHKMQAVRNSGMVKYLALEDGRYTEIQLRSTLMVKVTNA
jgi:hypothetical protein